MKVTRVSQRINFCKFVKAEFIDPGEAIPVYEEKTRKI